MENVVPVGLAQKVNQELVSKEGCYAQTCRHCEQCQPGTSVDGRLICGKDLL